MGHGKAARLGDERQTRSVYRDVDGSPLPYSTQTPMAAEKYPIKITLERPCHQTRGGRGSDAVKTTIMTRTHYKSVRAQNV